MLAIVLFNSSIFFKDPLNAEFQAEFIATMLKFETLFQCGQEEALQDLSKFFGELPLAEGKKLGLRAFSVGASAVYTFSLALLT